jgi:hypothetical protein
MGHVRLVIRSKSAIGTIDHRGRESGVLFAARELVAALTNQSQLIYPAWLILDTLETLD